MSVPRQTEGKPWQTNQKTRHFCVGALGCRRKRGTSSAAEGVRAANLVMHLSFVAPSKTSRSVKRHLNRDRKPTEAAGDGK